MRRSLAIVGLAPTGRGDFWGSDTCARLCRYSDVTPEWLAVHADFWNLYDREPGVQSRGYAELLARSLRGRHVLALGLVVGRALLTPEVRLWGAYAGEEGILSVTVVPHPSGANRLYNVPEARERLRRYVQLWRSHGE